jgi:hypothetical protein
MHTRSIIQSALQIVHDNAGFPAAGPANRPAKPKTRIKTFDDARPSPDNYSSSRRGPGKSPNFGV